MLTPRRIICAVTVAVAALLIGSQFVAYRSVEIGQPGYAGLAGVVTPPTVAARTPGQAHSYLLIPIAVLAAALAVAALRPSRRGLARLIIVLGLGSIAVILFIDRPAGLNAGVQASRFAGAHAVLENGFLPSWRRRRGLSLAVCSTMRGRAEYESTCQEGPQAPEEEDHDAGPQVGART